MLKPRPIAPPPAPLPFARTGAVAVLVAATAAAVGSVLDGAWADGRAPAPFVWADVALAHVVSAVPLALVLAALLLSRLSEGAVVAVAAGCVALGSAPLVEDVAAEPIALSRSDPALGTALRAALALALVAGGVLIAAVLTAARRPPADRIAWCRLLLPGAAGLVALLLPPITYADARCRHDLVRLAELLDQSRLGEARALAHGLAALDAGRTLNGRPVPEVVATLDRTVEGLEARVAAPLPAHLTTRYRLNRARDLAVLGRTGEALDVLRPVDDPGAAPEVEGLRGTIHETRGEWEPGAAAFRAARAAWERRPPSPERSAGVVRAVTGTAYCLRKAGCYTEAEAAYREVLTLAPTADSHFLLAQFYEDAQQSASAREHARRAIELAPDRYRTAGERLIEKMAVSQFGCFGVYAAERGRSGE